MTANSPSHSAAPVPEGCARAIDAYAAGQLSLSQLSSEISATLAQNASMAEPIHARLDDELKARRISIADYGQLVGALNSLASENIPTEYADDAPEQSGIYRIAAEGRLVPASRIMSPEPSSQTDRHGSSERALHTRPCVDQAKPSSVANSLPHAALSNAPAADDHAPHAPASYSPSPHDSPLPEVLLAGTVLRDRFRLDEEVARSPMGRVYRATDLLKEEAGAADPRVAIKLLQPELANNVRALKVFRNEIVNTQRLSHPNIIRLFELDHDERYHFISMEWLDGESLAELLDRRGTQAMELAAARPLIRQLCAALSYAHEQGVVHADVKPGNVFLTSGGGLKLIDFGIAASISNVAIAEHLGLTRAYASCERLERQASTPQDDVYSLGCVIYRMLAGIRAYGKLDALAAEAQGSEPAVIAALPASQWTALRRALALRRAERTATVAEFVAEFLDAAVSESDDIPILESVEIPPVRDQTPPVKDHTPPAQDPAGSPQRRRLLPAVLFGAAALAAALAMFWWFAGPDSPAPPRTVSLPAGAEREVAAAAAASDTAGSGVDSPRAATTDIESPQANAAPAVASDTGVLQSEDLPAAVPATEGSQSQPAAAQADAEPRSDPAVAAAGAGDAVAGSADFVTDAEATAEATQQNEIAVEEAVGGVAETEPQLSPDISVVTAEATADIPEPAAATPDADEPGDTAATESAALADVAADPVVETEEDVSPAMPAEVATVTLPPEPVALPVPAFDPGEPVALSELEFLEYVEPRYPRYVVDVGFSGWIDVAFTVGTDGRTRDVRISDGNLPPRFEAAAVRAISKWRFEPYEYAGTAYEVNSAVRLRYEN